MYCASCGAEMEAEGGTQMQDCYHFLCTGCIVDTVKTAAASKISCVAYNGVYRCTGYLDQDEVKCMVPDKVYTRYLRRVTKTEEAAAAALAEEGEDNEENVETDAAEESFVTLDLSNEEKSCGLAHKMAFIDDLVRKEGYSYEEAEQQWDMMPMLENRSVIRCPICFDDIALGDGIVLKDCFHMFCKNCIGGYIRASETAVVKCPDRDCDEPLKGSEVAALTDEAEYHRHFEQLSLKEAEASMANVAHCLTPNCRGFVIAEPGVVVFQCPVCRSQSCLQCKVLHGGSCAEYRQQIADDQNRVLQMQNDQLSEAAIRQNVNNRVFMQCPKCNVVIEKNGGCPNMTCHNPGCGHAFVWTGIPA